MQLIDDTRGNLYAGGAAAPIGLGGYGITEGSPMMVWAGVAIAAAALIYAAWNARDKSKMRSAAYLLAAALGTAAVAYGLSTETEAAQVVGLAGSTLGVAGAAAKTPTLTGSTPRIRLKGSSEPEPDPGPVLSITGPPGEQVIDVETPDSEGPPSWATR